MLPSCITESSRCVSPSLVSHLPLSKFRWAAKSSWGENRLHYLVRSTPLFLFIIVRGIRSTEIGHVLRHALSHWFSVERPRLGLGRAYKLSGTDHPSRALSVSWVKSGRRGKPKTSFYITKRKGKTDRNKTADLAGSKLAWVSILLRAPGFIGGYSSPSPWMLPWKRHAWWSDGGGIRRELRFLGIRADTFRESFIWLVSLVFGLASGGLTNL